MPFQNLTLKKETFFYKEYTLFLILFSDSAQLPVTVKQGLKTP